MILTPIQVIAEIERMSFIMKPKSYDLERAYSSKHFDEIIIIVMSFFKKIELADVLSKSRCRDFVIPRQLCMYFLYANTDNTLKFIGNHFSGRDHSTVVHAIQSVRDQYDVDKKYKVLFEAIEKEIKQAA